MPVHRLHTAAIRGCMAQSTIALNLEHLIFVENRGRTLVIRFPDRWDRGTGHGTVPKKILTLRGRDCSRVLGTERTFPERGTWTSSMFPVFKAQPHGVEVGDQWMAVVPWWSCHLDGSVAPDWNLLRRGELVAKWKMKKNL
jgi:hypothetical protein